MAATNSAGTTTSASHAITTPGVQPALTDDAPPATATVGSPYAYTFAASGSPAPTFAVSSGSLPPGLALDPRTGVLSGTPTTAGTSTFTVTATNSAGTVSGVSHTVTVGAPPAPPAAPPVSAPIPQTSAAHLAYTGVGPVVPLAVAGSALLAGGSFLL
ncbi:MAG: Ig domain-containing protein, partial [Blastococcus sp.]